jgi:hypothetical protein
MNHHDDEGGFMKATRSISRAESGTSGTGDLDEQADGWAGYQSNWRLLTAARLPIH